ncbi:MAG: Oxidoreductase, partial [Frankiales bacterium]|nr:Oxidoreductase [Frankiales bacterium]
VLVSPHSASTAAAENDVLTDLFIDNLLRFLSDQPLRNLYQRDLGY